MNKLEQAANTLKTSWCQGRYRKELDERETFCGVGALASVFESEVVLTDEDEQEFANLPDEVRRDEFFSLAVNKASESEEIKVLADVILEHYGDVDADGYGVPLRNLVSDHDPDDVVITFNDDVAKSADEVVSMFEKAAVKFDERV